MGATGKSLSRIMAVVDDKLLPLGARIAELGTQNLWCAGGAAVQFLHFFQKCGATVSMTEAEATSVANGGYLGSLLSGVGFDYTAFDIFEAPNTRLMDLNIHFVPSELQSKFDLVTNYGTTEHVLNQMLAMRSMHDLAKPGGLIHHDLPCGGYYLHCYFKYNPGVFSRSCYGEWLPFDFSRNLIEEVAANSFRAARRRICGQKILRLRDRNCLPKNHRCELQNSCR